MRIFKREVVEGVAIVTFEIHVLDGKNASRLTAHLEEATSQDTKIVLDLGSLEYFDTAGFAAILKWATTSPVVAVCSRSGAVRALLELVQADTIFSLYDRAEEALAIVGSSKSAAAAERLRTQLAHRQSA